MRASASWALMATATATLLGCQDEPTTPASVTATDSAGIVILDLAVDTAIPPNLRLATDPQLVVGATDTDTLQLFRVVDAELMPDGTLVVANAGSSEILYFDRNGTLTRRVGGAGSGPGEFRSISWIDRRPPDSLAVADGGLRRVVVLDGAGVSSRTVNLAGSAVDESASGVYAPQARAMFTDGSLLIANFSSLTPQSGPQRTEATLFRFDPVAGLLSNLGSWPAAEIHLLPSEGRLAVLLPLLGRDFVVEASAAIIVAGTTDATQLEILTPTGELSLILRWRGAERRLSQEQMAREARGRLEAFPDGPLLEQRLDEIEQISRHETVPAFAAIRVTDAGVIWVGSYALREDSTSTWLRVDPVKREVAHLDVPGSARVLDVTSDQMVLLTRDHLDREIVAVHELSQIGPR